MLTRLGSRAPPAVAVGARGEAPLRGDGRCVIVWSLGRGRRGDMQVTFAGKVALVAGGTGGLGRAVSLAFLDEGAKVAVTYRKPEDLESLRKDAGGNKAALQGYRVDVTDEAAVGELIEKIVAQYGRMDVLVNAVGGYAGGTKLWELDTRVFEQMLAMNLR